MAPAPAPLRGISSMATRALLAELAADYAARSGQPVTFESVGGVDAARRVAAGEAFDVVALADDALDKLADSGHVDGASRIALARSPIAAAVRAGAPLPDISTDAAFQAALRRARSIGVSTGPSGVQLRALFAQWGLGDELAARTVVAPPGVPVASLVAAGEVELGLQQASELIGAPGITLLGALPPGARIVTTFAAALGSASTQPEAARALLGFLASPQTAATKRRHGMESA
jgi:molybdate transport system substrate-binding protein